MFNTYYQDELLYLRELGREFAEANPEVASFLAEAGSDPDVERLLEGTAFLTGRIRQKLDDALPELSQSLLNLFWPQYLRPIPAMTVLQAVPGKQAGAGARELSAGLPVDSRPVDGCVCRFVTADTCQVVPLVVADIALDLAGRPGLRVRFAHGADGKIGELGCERLRLLLAGDALVTRTWYLILGRYLQRIEVRVAGEEAARPGDYALEAVGFAPEQRLLADDPRSTGGLSCLHEYFAFPERFLFFDLTGLACCADGTAATHVDVIFHFEQAGHELPDLEPANLLLGCVPALNRFPCDADPIRVEDRRGEYRVIPAGGRECHRRVHTVRRVMGMQRGSAASEELHPVSHLAPYHGEAGEYEVLYRESVVGEGSDCFLRLLENGPHYETLSLEVMATNGSLPRRLGIGEVDVATSDCPAGVAFRNVVRPSSAVPPPRDQELQWRLLAHLSLDARSFASVETLRSLIELYDFRALVDRGAAMTQRTLLEGITSVTAAPATRLLDGVPIRGVAIDVELDETCFASPGALYLFGAVLDAVFRESVSLNSFSQLTVTGVRHREVHRWPMRLGRGRVL